MVKRQKSASYFFFYILFLPDTWRILVGLLAAVFLAPAVATPQIDTFGRTVLYLMITAIGYAVSGAPARGISRAMKHLLLGGPKQ